MTPQHSPHAIADALHTIARWLCRNNPHTTINTTTTPTGHTTLTIASITPADTTNDDHHTITELATEANTLHGDNITIIVNHLITTDCTNINTWDIHNIAGTITTTPE